MERLILSVLLLLSLTTKAQTILNGKGVYEIIKVEQYEDVNSEILYDTFPLRTSLTPFLISSNSFAL